MHRPVAETLGANNRTIEADEALMRAADSGSRQAPSPIEGRGLRRLPFIIILHGRFRRGTLDPGQPVPDFPAQLRKVAGRRIPHGHIVDAMVTVSQMVAKPDGSLPFGNPGQFGSFPIQANKRLAENHEPVGNRILPHAVGKKRHPVQARDTRLDPRGGVFQIPQKGLGLTLQRLFRDRARSMPGRTGYELPPPGSVRPCVPAPRLDRTGD